MSAKASATTAKRLEVSFTKGTTSPQVLQPHRGRGFTVTSMPRALLSPASCKPCWMWAWAMSAWAKAATTLSGGEAQRVKLALELSKPRHRPHPLHPGRTHHRPALCRHCPAAQSAATACASAGNTIVVIEHNLDVIKTADWLVDIGPEGGARRWPLSWPRAPRKTWLPIRRVSPGGI
jgi:hypothetical protein